MSIDSRQKNPSLLAREIVALTDRERQQHWFSEMTVVFRRNGLSGRGFRGRAAHVVHLQTERVAQAMRIEGRA